MTYWIVILIVQVSICKPFLKWPCSTLLSVSIRCSAGLALTIIVNVELKGVQFTLSANLIGSRNLLTEHARVVTVVNWMRRDYANVTPVLEACPQLAILKARLIFKSVENHQAILRVISLELRLAFAFLLKLQSVRYSYSLKTALMAKTKNYCRLGKPQNTTKHSFACWHAAWGACSWSSRRTLTFSFSLASF